MEGKLLKYLITGGAGSIASGLINHLLQQSGTKGIVAYDNNEYGLARLPQHPSLVLAVGDVRDKNRLRETLHNVDVVVHAASLKRIEMAELNVKETIKTNVLGTINVAEACAENGICKLLLISSDKAVPTEEFSLYGATKYLQEKIVLAAHGSVARFGNVMGTHGDVLEIWAKQNHVGKPLTVTDPHMQRYFWSMESAVNFIASCLTQMKGDEIFVPKMEEVNIMQFKNRYYPSNEVELIGMRPGETIRHELMTPSEMVRATEFEWGWKIT